MLWVQVILSALLIAAFSSVCAHESCHVQRAPAAAAPRQNLAPFNASMFPQLSPPDMSLGVPFRFRWPINWPFMYLADDQEEYFHMRQNSQYKLKVPGPWYLAWIWPTLHVQSYLQTFHRGCISGRWFQMDHQARFVTSNHENTTSTWRCGYPEMTKTTKRTQFDGSTPRRFRWSSQGCQNGLDAGPFLWMWSI